MSGHGYPPGSPAAVLVEQAHREMATDRVLAAVQAERGRQRHQWGEQNHPDGTGLMHEDQARLAREACDTAFRCGYGTWRHVLAEEVAEAFAEFDPDRLRTELLQVAAVAVAWVEAIDRREQS